jgi:hypothetical protein
MSQQPEASNQPPTLMSVGTLLRYLIGSRSAILQIATTPSALALGVLFVLSAGLAREYDAKDLSREPWYLVVPLVASLVTSFILYCLVARVARARSVTRRPFWATYPRFLTLYWMTAPLAWIYAIPFDRFLSPVDATAANLSSLAVVSIWRVALMTRVVVVYFGFPTMAAFWVVMLFGDTIAVFILFFTQLNVVGIMSGVQPSESEHLVRVAAMWVGCFGGLSWLVWLTGVALLMAPGESWNRLSAVQTPRGRVGLSLWCVAAIMILGLIPVLPKTQAEQRLRYDIEHAFQEDRTVDAVRTMSAHAAAEFPPNWDPPPRISHHAERLLEVLEATLDENAAPWVHELYLEKTLHSLDYYVHVQWQRISSEEKERLLRVIERLPAKEQQRFPLQVMRDGESDPTFQKRLDTLIGTGKPANTPPFSNNQK